MILSFLQQASWSPYLVGAGIGVLLWMTFLLSDKPMGTSTTFARVAGLLERIFSKQRVIANPYYQKIGIKIDWQFLFVIGIAIGAFLSAVSSGNFHVIWVPSLWVHHFGAYKIKRIVCALIGGVLVGFGARFAGGCTSGHGISGTLQFVLSSWLATVFFFVGGCCAAFVIFHFFGI